MSNKPNFNKANPPRTWLFVPADKIERIPKAFASGADSIIIDLEDSIATDQKNQARQNLQAHHNSPTYKPLWVRINHCHHQHFDADIQACKDMPNLAGVILPKAEQANDIESVHQNTGLPVIALIETAVGLANLNKIATANGLLGLSYGLLDLCHELNIQTESEASNIIMQQIRYQLLLTSKIHQLIAPIDTIYPNFHDTQGLQQRVKTWSQMGFSGMLCIHPKQIDPIHQSLTPSPQELELANKILTEYKNTGKMAFQIDGIMIDRPRILQAEKLINQNKTAQSYSQKTNDN